MVSRRTGRRSHNRGVDRRRGGPTGRFDVLVGRTAEQGTGQAAHAGQRPAGTANSWPRVVIAHDFLECFGGAERVTEEMARAFPDASVHAILARDSVLERMGIADRFE